MTKPAILLNVRVMGISVNDMITTAPVRLSPDGQPVPETKEDSFSVRLQFIGENSPPQGEFSILLPKKTNLEVGETYEMTLQKAPSE